MLLHGCFGFIGVHDLLAIQENGDAPRVGECMPEEERHPAAENLNPILGLDGQTSELPPVVVMPKTFAFEVFLKSFLVNILSRGFKKLGLARSDFAIMVRLQLSCLWRVFNERGKYVNSLKSATACKVLTHCSWVLSLCEVQKATLRFRQSLPLSSAASLSSRW